jgi:aryl-alcohol dehydrogenase-like predicted oxidoreductase
VLAKTPRESVVISTKLGPKSGERFSTKSAFKTRFEGNLTRLQTDDVDLLNLHEAFGPDPQHAMLGPAVANDSCWDVVMERTSGRSACSPCAAS